MLSLKSTTSCETTRDLRAQVVLRDLPQIGAANADRPLGGVHKPQEQVGHGRLAGTALAHERDDLAGLDGKIEVRQRRLLAIAEAHVVKHDVRARRRQRLW
jgi:hypothetical protein